MFKKRKVKKGEWILLLVLFIIIIGMLMDDSIRKTYANFTGLEEQIALNEKKLFKLKAILARPRELNSEYENLFSRYGGLKDSDKLLQEISNIARKLKVNILDIKPTLVKDNEKYKIYSIKIESQDSAPVFAKFLYILSEELKAVGVERLQIKAQGKDELPRISLLLNAAAFKE